MARQARGDRRPTVPWRRGRRRHALTASEVGLPRMNPACQLIPGSPCRRNECAIAVRPIGIETPAAARNSQSPRERAARHPRNRWKDRSRTFRKRETRPSGRQPTPPARVTGPYCWPRSVSLSLAGVCWRSTEHEKPPQARAGTARCWPHCSGVLPIPMVYRLKSSWILALVLAVNLFRPKKASGVSIDA